MRRFFLQGFRPDEIRYPATTRPTTRGSTRCGAHEVGGRGVGGVDAGPRDDPAPDMERLADRLLLGSDAPNTPVSAGDRLAAVRGADLSSAAVAAITGGTARGLQDAICT